MIVQCYGKYGQKIDNKYLLEKRLETLKIYYDRKLLTKEPY